MTEFAASIGCNYFQGKVQWQIQVRPTFVDISCPAKRLRISLDVDLKEQKNMITYDEDTEYKCGADVTEGKFVSDTCTLVVGSRMYVDEEDSSEYSGETDGYAELMSNGCHMSMEIPFEVAKIMYAIAKGDSTEKLEEMGAKNIWSL
jgi:hypothetical protein